MLRFSNREKGLKGLAHRLVGAVGLDQEVDALHGRAVRALGMAVEDGVEHNWRTENLRVMFP